MTVDELVEVLNGLTGRNVEAILSVADKDGGDGPRGVLSSFSGTVDKVARSDKPSEHWKIWWKKDGEAKPNYGAYSVWRDGYERAEIRGSDRSLEEIEAEDDESTGAIWEVWIWQSGIVTELLVYV